MSPTPDTLRWEGGVDGCLVLLDQTRLPDEIVELRCRAVEDVWHAIRRLAVRGAPLIGIAAAYGVCLSRENHIGACDYLATSRPTAVNLFWALDRMRRAVREENGGACDLAERLLAEARAIQEEDCLMCAAIGRFGADLLADLPVGSSILTHCNTGALVAAGGDGTALAVIFELVRRGKRLHVWVDETRPLLQGARLTSWELSKRGVDCTVICDSAAAHVMREGRVAAAIVGADRIAGNGDVANKIGTYSVAALAAVHDLPLYVAAPASTFDLSLPSGESIPIELRAGDEIAAGLGRPTVPTGVAVYNPAFDVTPAQLIRALITDRGVIHPVNRESIDRVLGCDR